MITSTSNKKAAEVRNLGKKASLRRELSLFTVEGIRMFAEIPEQRVRSVFVTERFLEGCPDKIREKIRRLPFELVTEEVFSSMSDTKTPQGVLAVAEQEKHSLADVLRGERTCLLVLETIQDPGNLGTMLRAGEGAGLTGIVADAGTADIYNPKVIRSTMGSIFRVPVVYVQDLRETILELKRQKVQICAAHLRGSVDYDRADYTGASAFLIGNEAKGLTDGTAALADRAVKIPMLGKVESLNAAVAASVLMYELARQRRNYTDFTS